MPTQMHAVTLCDYHIIVSVQELKRGDWMAATSFKGIPYTARSGVVCGRGRNPTLRLWPAIFSGEIDVFPSERRNMGQEIGR